jgi:hypothetical protein
VDAVPFLIKVRRTRKKEPQLQQNHPFFLARWRSKKPKASGLDPEGLGGKLAETKKPNIGLALSGGGFRATLFHLGLIRFLRDAGLLSNVTQPPNAVALGTFERKPRRLLGTNVWRSSATRSSPAHRPPPS